MFASHISSMSTVSSTGSTVSSTGSTGSTVSSTASHSRAPVPKPMILTEIFRDLRQSLQVNLGLCIKFRHERFHAFKNYISIYASYVYVCVCVRARACVYVVAQNLLLNKLRTEIQFKFIYRDYGRRGSAALTTRNPSIRKSQH
jgi:hypothetical protein